MKKRAYNLLEENESSWAFFPEAGLPTLVVCRSMPIGTVFFDTELKAIDFKLNEIAIIQKELERRRNHLKYKQQEKQYEDAGILPQTQ